MKQLTLGILRDCVSIKDLVNGKKKKLEKSQTIRSFNFFFSPTKSFIQIQPKKSLLVDHYFLHH